MKLRYTVSYEVIFDVPDGEEYLGDELGAIAESFVRDSLPESWDLGDIEFEINKFGHEDWGEVEE